MSKKETPQDIERRELFYKMKRWRLASIALPVVCLFAFFLFYMVSDEGFQTQLLSYPACAVVFFVIFRKNAKFINNQLLEKGGLSPEEAAEYTDIFNKAWRKQFIIWIVILVVGGVAIWGSRNAGSSSKSTEYKECSWCGKRVKEDDLRGSWCGSCQKDAFGDGGWYN